MKIGEGIQTLRSSIFRDVLQGQWVVCYQLFGTACG